MEIHFVDSFDVKGAKQFLKPRQRDRKHPQQER